ncbi:MAG: GNAT family N-acetyltransferase, partial [Candidatus Omnitrophica bacterium]|nr:GNAT family N-acetyltransferase [Candidatus Omnitrophota bacterium]
MLQTFPLRGSDYYRQLALSRFHVGAQADARVLVEELVYSLQETPGDLPALADWFEQRGAPELAGVIYQQEQVWPSDADNESSSGAHYFSGFGARAVAALDRFLGRFVRAVWRRLTFGVEPMELGKRVVEVGPGRGRVTERLVHAYPDAHFWVFERNALVHTELWHRLGGASNVTVVPDSIQFSEDRLPLEGTIDTVLVLFPFYRELGAQEEALAQTITRLLKPGGQLMLVTEHGWWSPLFFWDHDWWVVQRFKRLLRAEGLIAEFQTRARWTLARQIPGFTQSRFSRFPVFSVLTAHKPLPAIAGGSGEEEAGRSRQRPKEGKTFSADAERLTAELVDRFLAGENLDADSALVSRANQVGLDDWLEILRAARAKQLARGLSGGRRVWRERAARRPVHEIESRQPTRDEEAAVTAAVSSDLFTKTDTSRKPRRLLTQQEERRLIRLAQAGNPAARHLLITANEKLIDYIVSRVIRRVGDMRERLFEREDLFAAGVTGLLAAIDSFNVRRSSRLAAYAGTIIRSHITEEIAHWLPITQRLWGDVAELRHLGETLGRQPTEDELMGVLGWGRDRAKSTLALDALREYSLNRPFRSPESFASLPRDPEDVEAQRALEGVQIAQMAEELAWFRAYLRRKRISVRDQNAWLLQRLGTVTFEQVGQLYGFTRERARQLASRVDKVLNTPEVWRHLRISVLPALQSSAEPDDLQDASEPGQPEGYHTLNGEGHLVPGTWDGAPATEHHPSLFERLGLTAPPITMDQRAGKDGGDFSPAAAGDGVDRQNANAQRLRRITNRGLIQELLSSPAGTHRVAVQQEVHRRVREEAQPLVNILVGYGLRSADKELQMFVSDELMVAAMQVPGLVVGALVGGLPDAENRAIRLHTLRHISAIDSERAKVVSDALVGALADPNPEVVTVAKTLLSEVLGKEAEQVIASLVGGLRGRTRGPEPSKEQLERKQEAIHALLEEAMATKPDPVIDTLINALEIRGDADRVAAERASAILIAFVQEHGERVRRRLVDAIRDDPTKEEFGAKVLSAMVAGGSRKHPTGDEDFIKEHQQDDASAAAGEGGEEDVAIRELLERLTRYHYISHPRYGVGRRPYGIDARKGRVEVEFLKGGKRSVQVSQLTTITRRQYEDERRRLDTQRAEPTPDEVDPHDRPVAGGSGTAVPQIVRLQPQDVTPELLQSLAQLEAKAMPGEPQEAADTAAAVRQKADSEHFKRYFTSVNQIVLLLRDGPVVVGYAVGGPLERYADELRLAQRVMDGHAGRNDTVYLSYVLVHPAYRQQGWGSRLIDAFATDAVLSGARYLTAIASSRRVRQYLEHLGAEEVPQKGRLDAPYLRLSLVASDRPHVIAMEFGSPVHGDDAPAAAEPPAVSSSVETGRSPAPGDLWRLWIGWAILQGARDAEMVFVLFTASPQKIPRLMEESLRDTLEAVGATLDAVRAPRGRGGPSLLTLLLVPLWSAAILASALLGGTTDRHLDDAVLPSQQTSVSLAAKSTKRPKKQPGSDPVPDPTPAAAAGQEGEHRKNGDVSISEAGRREDEMSPIKVRFGLPSLLPRRFGIDRWLRSEVMRPRHYKWPTRKEHEAFLEWLRASGGIKHVREVVMPSSDLFPNTKRLVFLTLEHAHAPPGDVLVIYENGTVAAVAVEKNRLRPGRVRYAPHEWAVFHELPPGSQAARMILSWLDALPQASAEVPRERVEANEFGEFAFQDSEGREPRDLVLFSPLTTPQDAARVEWLLDADPVTRHLMTMIAEEHRG